MISKPNGILYDRADIIFIWIWIQVLFYFITLCKLLLYYGVLLLYILLLYTIIYCMYIFYYCSFTGAPSVLGSALALASESSRMHACNKTTERHGRTYKLHAHPWAVALTHLISQSTLASLTVFRVRRSSTATGRLHRSIGQPFCVLHFLCRLVSLLVVHGGRGRSGQSLRGGAIP